MKRGKKLGVSEGIGWGGESDENFVLKTSQRTGLLFYVGESAQRIREGFPQQSPQL